MVKHILINSNSDNNLYWSENEEITEDPRSSGSIQNVSNRVFKESDSENFDSKNSVSNKKRKTTQVIDINSSKKNRILFDKAKAESLLNSCEETLNLERNYNYLSSDTKEIGSYYNLSSKIINDELETEIPKLRSLLTLSDDQICLKFEKLCRTREENNQETFLSYFSYPDGVCNKLYHDVARALFNPQTYSELITLILPNIINEIIVELNHRNQPNNQNTFSVTISKVKFNQAEHSLLSQKIDDNLNIFKHLTLDDSTSIFDIRQVSSYSFTLHQKLYIALETFPKLKQNIYNHNSCFRDLSSDLRLFSSAGLDFKTALTEFAEELRLSGERISGELHARPQAEHAILRFTNFFNQYSPQNQNLLMHLISPSGKVLGSPAVKDSVMWDLAVKADCVETASLHLHEILLNPANQLYLNARPNSSAHIRLKDFKDKYKDKKQHPLNSATDRIETRFPAQLASKHLSSLVIDELDTLVDLLINFPTDQYANLLSHVSFGSYSVFDENENIFNILETAESKAALFNAMSHQEVKFNLGHNALLLQKNMISSVDSITLQAVLSTLTDSEFLNDTDFLAQFIFELVQNTNPRVWEIVYKFFGHSKALANALSQANEDGYSPIHFAAKRKHPEPIKMIVTYLKEQDKLNILKSNSIGVRLSPVMIGCGNSNSEILKILLDSLTCTDEAIEELQKTNEFGEVALHIASENSNDSILEIVSSFLKSGNKLIENISALDRLGMTPIHSAALCNHPIHLKQLLNFLENDTVKLEELYRKDFKKKSVLDYIAESGLEDMTEACISTIEDESLKHKINEEIKLKYSQLKPAESDGDA